MDLLDRAPSEKELVFQSKILCRDFIYSRITREGLSWSKVEASLQVPDGNLGDVSVVLLKLGDELEYMRPYVYRNIAKQLSISVSVESVVSDAFLSVATEILSLGITWGKVVAVFAVAGGLAVDCVRQGCPAVIHTIVDSMGEFVRKSLVPWLRRRGGWKVVVRPGEEKDVEVLKIMFSIKHSTSGGTVTHCCGDISKCVKNMDSMAEDHWLSAVVSTWRHVVKTMYIYLMK